MEGGRRKGREGRREGRREGGGKGLLTLGKDRATPEALAPPTWELREGAGRDAGCIGGGI